VVGMVALSQEGGFMWQTGKEQTNYAW
jgi:hypothetical protein